MTDNDDIPDNVPCPYCGAGNPPDGVLCGVCQKKLLIPPEVRAEAGTRRLLREAAGGAGDVSGGTAARPAHRLWGRAALIAALALFYSRWLSRENYFSFLDFVNLAVHEAGHLFLGFFGRFIMMLGGTLFQLLLPAVCLFHLLRRGANIGWQLCLFWIGESLLNISIYAGDAIRQELPLVGGGEHDWTYLLTATGLIAHTEGVARFIFFCGSAVIAASLWLIARDALAREPYEFGRGGDDGFW